MKIHRWSTTWSLGLTLIVWSATSSLAIHQGPFPGGVPGSGYGCDNPCNTGDKNYVVHAEINTYTMKNSGHVHNPQPLSPDGQDIAYQTRTFVGQSELSSPFCLNGYNGTTGPLGPCLSVNPGETLMFKMINKMNNGMNTTFQQVPADQNEFFKFIDSIPAGALPGLRAKKASDLKVLNQEDLPGVRVSFDDTNLHLHGLHVTPHMFYPQGTPDPEADWITITVSSR
jgi:FtsP/CotA-like multicopper oxidase with cupredoxin domain